MTATLHDIAWWAEVSQTTAQRVLNGTRQTRRDITARAVWAAAKGLEWQPRAGGRTERHMVIHGAIPAPTTTIGGATYYRHRDHWVNTHGAAVVDSLAAILDKKAHA